MTKKLNIDDISKMAGVSKATVSRVLNNSDKVNSNTRQNILNIIEKYNYQPSNLARALSKKTSKIIGVIIEDLANPFFTEIARGIETVLHNNGYIMFLTSSNWNRAKEEEIINKLYRNQIDGLLITPIIGQTPLLKALKENNLPIVFINYKDTDPSQCFVTSDNVKGAELGTNLLIKDGYEEIMCLKGFEHQTANDRVTGFYRELARHNTDKIKFTLITGVNRLMDGYNFIKEHADYFKKINHRCGIFALNDFIALGLLDALIDEGIPVPDKVAVIGYDDISFAERYKIPITTIRQSKYRLGELAAEQLLARIIGTKETAAQIILEPELIIRKSCPKLY